MTLRLPTIEIVDETMREGMQIESTDIPVSAKVDLLNRLSRTGLSTIVVGSFVSPKWVPQMAEIEAVLRAFDPAPGVTYRALALNERGVQRRREFMPPLSVPDGPDAHETKVHLCDTFVRRNTNRSTADEIAGWPRVVQRAVDAGAASAGISLNAAWGSNWEGQFSSAQRMELLQQQHGLWSAAGIPVTKVWLGDPMSWNAPHVVSEQLRELVQTWPQVTTYHLHLHNTRGLALTSAYAAMEVLDERHTLVVDTAVGGIGGCPYCGNGRATGMIATEDFVHMLHGMGVDTGVDLPALLEVAQELERVIGRRLYGHVSQGGPWPLTPEMAYDPDLPLVETVEQAQHFRARLRHPAPAGAGGVG